MELRRREDSPLKAPNPDGNVWPKQTCPAFEPRADSPIGVCQCWYCRYADFHLNQTRSLEVGICCWPKKAETIHKNKGEKIMSQVERTTYKVSQIEKLSPAEFSRTLEETAQAFARDPFFLFMFRSQKELKRFLEVSLLYYFKCGLVYGAFDEKNTLQGISLWNEPGGALITVKNVLVGGFLGKFCSLLFHLRPVSFYRMLKMSDFTQMHHPKSAHFYLFLLAAFQPGAGGALLDFAAAQFHGHEFYLENSNPPANNVFYQKRGFAFLPELKWRDCTLQPMLRKAGTLSVPKQTLAESELELVSAGAILYTRQICPKCGSHNCVAVPSALGGYDNTCRGCGATWDSGR